MISAKVEVVGLKEALRELQKIDPKLRLKVTKDFKKITKPVEQAAKVLIPKQPPLSGWAKGWKTKSGYQMLPDSGWQGAKADKLVKSKVSSKRPREYAGVASNVTVFMANTVFDVAGRLNKNGDTKAGALMIQALERKFGKASRVLWRAYDANKAEVERQTLELTKQVMADVGKSLKIK
jgi:putative transposon-encoded protein